MGCMSQSLYPLTDCVNSMDHSLQLYLRTLDTVTAAEDMEELRSFCIQFLLMMASADLNQYDFDWLLSYTFGPNQDQSIH